MKRHRLGAVLFLLCCWVGSAHAASVTRTVADDGTVDVRMVMSVPLAAVQAFLARGVDTMSLGSDILSVSSQPSGECEEMAVKTRGVFQPMSYTVRRCPVPGGWRSTLVRSEDFVRHDTEWLALAVEGGTEVRIRVRVQPRLPVPMFVIRKAVGNALAQTLETLNDKLQGEQP